MKVYAIPVVMGLAVALQCPAVVAAQQKPTQQEIIEQSMAAAEAAEKAAQARELATRIPLQIQVVVSRYQGEKKISSLPYAISINANDREMSRLRMGARVPVSTVVAPQIGPVRYEDIGTNIDCRARTYGTGQFELEISVEDKSVHTNTQPAATPTAGDLPVFRSFQSSNTLILRDGQSRQFTAATDRISGEVIRVDVTLTVVK